MSPDYAGAWQVWLWGSVLTFLALALVLAVTRARAPLALLGVWRRVMAIPSPVFVTSAALVFAALTVLCTLFIFDGNPRNVDGFAQLFQARIFLAGRLWVPAPPELANFATLQMILGPDKWYSQYPPGQSAILAAGIKAGAWWILNPVLAAVFAAHTWRVARWCGGEAVARLTLLLLCLSPFVVAVAGSEMSHLAAATLGMTGAALATMSSERRSGLWPLASGLWPLASGLWPLASGLWPLASGLVLGLMTSFRPLDAVAASIAAGTILFFWSPRRMLSLGAMAAGGIVGAIPTLWFNARTTGSPTTFGYTVLWGPQHSLGFHDVPFGIPLTFTRALARSGLDLHQLNVNLLDSPIPVLLIVAAGFVAGRRLLGDRDAIPFVGVLALVGLMFFYWHRDVFYGPRFIYSATGWFVILLARAIVLLRRSRVRDDDGGIGLTASFAALAAIAFGAVALTPTRLKAFKRTTPIFALHPDRDAARAGITNAVVLVPDGWGTRLAARMWQLGVPVRRSTRLYSSIDACTLEATLTEAERDTTARERLISTLTSLAARHQPGVRARVTDDPNLRIPEGELPAPCREQIEVDRRGFYQFAPDLWLNRATLDGDIVWARDLGPGNAALFARYAGRRFYRYVPQNGAPALIPVDGPGW